MGLPNTFRPRPLTSTLPKSDVRAVLHSCHVFFFSCTLEARGKTHADSCSPPLSTEHTLTVNKHLKSINTNTQSQQLFWRECSVKLNSRGFTNKWEMLKLNIMKNTMYFLVEFCWGHWPCKNQKDEKSKRRKRQKVNKTKRQKVL